LDCTPGELSLSVKDDGVGLTAHNGNGADAGHYGIVGMRERANEIGARFQLASQPGQGTTISVVLPLPSGSATSPEKDGR
jgi:signal transduction histidine kinase